MLLTLSQPASTDFGTRTPYEFKSPPLPRTASRYSPRIMNESSSRLSHHLSGNVPPTMSTQHRGLPPPAAMALPDPGRQQHPPPPPPPPGPPSHPLGVLPEPPATQWRGEQDSMRNWLATKAEEERRKQEEERTRQESLRLEQRRVEQAMLRESMQGGVPPHMVPMIFAGIGGANLANYSLELLQQYTSQLQAAQQFQSEQMSPELRRENRSIQHAREQYSLAGQPLPSSLQSAPGAPLQQQQQQPPPPPPPLASQQTTFSAYRQPSPPRIPASASRTAAHSALPRLTTGDIQIQQPPTAPSSAHPGLVHGQSVQMDQQTSSPIYFHHWVPPTSQSDKTKGEPQTPISVPGASHLGESDYTSSPHKRKAPGPHQAAPAPSTSPQFSASGSAKKPAAPLSHARSRSNASKEGDPSARATPARRDSGAPGTQVDFVVNVAGGPPPAEVLRRGRADTLTGSSSSQKASTAPSSPKREYR